ncbi:MAG: DNA polymerase III subunit gamma/tau [Pseudomonadota bacterium]|nr:DNA polymerase III subunit gamma/tau [Pseudomonadota bacterium]
MSYQVLARKWRPRSFQDMVGQAHVVRALGNALEQGQLHHAYLFTGTRGVGKTTLARILAKALNCEEGVTSHPCGQCAACREIDEGRFVDLLEVDAASRTKVDQTRELLDNVPFAPVKGRYKVYLIDEVHMFSSHSFNALLKTLEEPPPHVKFLLATTDPQKVPVTVLSRCLQFNLKRLVPVEIQQQLAHILGAEDIGFEEPALPLLARAADGSMRDGLSLLDQAIAFGGGRVGADEVRSMLGTVDRDLSLKLVQALAALDGPELLDLVARIAELTPDFTGVLRELLGILHRIALFQQVPTTLADEDPDREPIEALAREMAPEDVQLFYQIALLGQEDLTLAPDPRAGIEMVLLRMLAFRPDTGDEPGRATARSEKKVAQSASPRSAADGGDGPAASPGPAAAALVAARQATASETKKATKAGAALRVADSEGPDSTSTFVNRIAEPDRPVVARAPMAGGTDTGLEPQSAAESDGPVLREPTDWHRLVGTLRLGGVASELASNCELAGWDGRRLVLTLDPECRHMQVASAKERLHSALSDALGRELRLEVRIARPERETPAQRRARLDGERQAEAQALMEKDPLALALQDQFDARWVPGSIEPTD